MYFITIRITSIFFLHEFFVQKKDNFIESHIGFLLVQRTNGTRKKPPFIFNLVFLLYNSRYIVALNEQIHQVSRV